MTDDLLGKIFYHLCDPGPLPLRHLLFVSKRFYSVAVNSAHLWTTITFDSHLSCRFRQWREQSTIFVEQCLVRSSPFPLRLYIDTSWFFAYYHFASLNYFLEIFWKPEWRALQRCTSMILDKGCYTETTLPMIVALLPKSLPSLQYISLSYFDDPIDGSQFPNCPVLERVELYHGGQHSSPFWGMNFLHVTTLSFGMFAWNSDDITTLLQFPVLHDLTLFVECDTGYSVAYDLKHPIHFKHLQILRARGRIPSWIVSKLVAPALKELHIKTNAQHVTSIYELRHLFEPHCQHIYAVLPKAISSGQPAWATYLSDLVEKCTRIKSLYVSKWMEEECEKFLSSRNDVVLHVQ